MNDISYISYDFALLEAARTGNGTAIAALIQHCDPKANNSQALREAVDKGHTECAKLLIPVSDPKANDSEALRVAAYHGNTECVKLLIPLCDPKAYDSAALFVAALHGHNDIVDLLWDVSDPQAALARLRQDFADEKHQWIYTQQKWEAQVLRKKLVDSHLGCGQGIVKKQTRKI